MGKHEAGSAKALANAQKARGLNKLKFYCQICEKECRDENGFKCHLTTEGHLRREKLFRSNAKNFLDNFSERFQKGFLEILSHRHNTKRVSANVVYNEYIQDRHHIHMNSTKWVTLSQFVQHLGESGQCKIDETERGWYVQWLDRDNAKLLARQLGTTNERKRKQGDDEDRRRREIKKQIRAAHNKASKDGEAVNGGMDLAAADPTNVSASIALPVVGKKKKRPRLEASAFGAQEEGEEDDDENNEKGQDKGTQKQSSSMNDSGANDGSESQLEHAKTTKRSVAGEIAKQEQSKSKRERVELFQGTWLAPGLVVKIVTSSLGKDSSGKKYKKRKGTIQNVSFSDKGKPRAVLELLDNPLEKLTIKESYVETVLPDLGNSVSIVSDQSSFPNRGQLAKLVDIDIEKFKATVELPCGRTLKLEYENVCKAALARNKN